MLTTLFVDTRKAASNPKDRRKDVSNPKDRKCLHPDKEAQKNIPQNGRFNSKFYRNHSGKKIWLFPFLKCGSYTKIH